MSYFSSKYFSVKYFSLPTLISLGKSKLLYAFSDKKKVVYKEYSANIYLNIFLESKINFISGVVAEQKIEIIKEENIDYLLLLDTDIWLLEQHA